MENRQTCNYPNFDLIATINSAWLAKSHLRGWLLQKELRYNTVVELTSSAENG